MDGLRSLCELGGRGVVLEYIDCRAASAVLGRRTLIGMVLTYAELGVDVSVGRGDFSRGDRGSSRSA